MSPRERNLLVVFIAILLCGGGGVGVVVWFVQPLKDIRANIAKVTDDRNLLQEQLAAFQRDSKKLAVARTRSLPTQEGEAKTEYMAYLQKLLADARLVVDILTPSQASDMKFATTIPGIKKVEHKTITFQVRAQGELSQLVTAMERMARTPYEHRIKSLTIDRVDMATSAKDKSPKLAINMTVETLLVANADAKKALPLGWGRLGAAVALQESVEMPEDRDYRDIALKNIFTGAFPPPPPPPPKPPKMDPKPPPPPPPPVDDSPKPPPEYVPAYVRLVQVAPDLQEAYLRNIVYRIPETKLIAKPRSGYELFRVTDEDAKYVYFQAKVLRVDSREIYFQIKDQVYELKMGMSLADAIEHPLSIDRMDDLDLFDIFDREFAKKGAADTKSKTPTKKTSTMGTK